MKTKKFLKNSYDSENIKKAHIDVESIGIKKPKVLLSREEIYRRAGVSAKRMAVFEFIENNPQFLVSETEKSYELN